MLPVFQIEEQIVTAVQVLHTVPLDYLFQLISVFGNPIFWILIAALLYWSNKERESFFLMNTIVFASAVSSALKVFFARPRPSIPAKRTMLYTKISEIIEMNTPTFGLPSGHATTVTATLVFFSKNKKPITLVGFAAIALLVAFSRIYIGVHYPLDAIAGLGVGLLVGLASVWMQKVFEKHDFHLSRMKDEAIVIILIAAAIIAIALIDVPVLAVSVLGYYVGFFFSKEVGFKQNNYAGRKKALKLFAGTISALIMLVLTAILYTYNEQLALLCFFGNGFWLTFGFPEFFDKAMKYLHYVPALERILK